MGHQTISMTERYRRGYIPWDESKEAKKNTRITYWKHVYHKPYQCDWYQATQKATLKMWRIGEMSNERDQRINTRTDGEYEAGVR